MSRLAALLLGLSLPGVAVAQSDGNVEPAAPPAVDPAEVPQPSGRPLREIAPVERFPLLVGGSMNAADFDTSAEVILSREYGFVTPGNDFKQAAIHPEPDKWRWKKPDLWPPRWERDDQIVRLHAAISPQCSAWAKDDARTGPELAANMEEYLTAVCRRYRDNPRVRWIDVVNETVSRDGAWFGPRPGAAKWENPWTQIGSDDSTALGVPLYIPRAFEIAGREAPDWKLVYNQHGGMEPGMWNRVKATIEYLRAKGLRVDAVGWQAHIDAGFEQNAGDMARLNDLIDWCHDRNLEFHITENTVWIRDGETPETQAATFAAIVRTLLEHSDDGVVGWNAWQMRDTDNERAELRGCLFDADGRPKPAYKEVRKELVAFRKARRETAAP